MALGRELRSFAEAAPLPGVERALAAGDDRFLRFAWYATTVACLIIAAVQLHSEIANFVVYPTTVNVFDDAADRPDFPDVTVCVGGDSYDDLRTTRRDRLLRRLLDDGEVGEETFDRDERPRRTLIGDASSSRTKRTKRATTSGEVDLSVSSTSSPHPSPSVSAFLSSITSSSSSSSSFGSHFSPFSSRSQSISSRSSTPSVVSSTSSSSSSSSSPSFASFRSSADALSTFSTKPQNRTPIRQVVFYGWDFDRLMSSPAENRRAGTTHEVRLRVTADGRVCATIRSRAAFRRTTRAVSVIASVDDGGSSGGGVSGDGDDVLFASTAFEDVGNDTSEREASSQRPPRRASASYASGAFVVVHARHTYPDRPLGVAISSGTQTTLTVALSVRSRLPHPYGNCTDSRYLDPVSTVTASSSGSSSSSPEVDGASSRIAYSTDACYGLCYQRKIVIPTCGCVAAGKYANTVAELNGNGSLIGGTLTLCGYPLRSRGPPRRPTPPSDASNGQTHSNATTSSVPTAHTAADGETRGLRADDDTTATVRRALTELDCLSTLRQSAPTTTTTAMLSSLCDCRVPCLEYQYGVETSTVEPWPSPSSLREFDLVDFYRDLVDDGESTTASTPDIDDPERRSPSDAEVRRDDGGDDDDVDDDDDDVGEDVDGLNDRPRCRRLRSSIENRFFRVDVVFARQGVQRLNDTLAADWQSLVSAVGGCLSLWTGLGAMAVVDAIQLVYRLVFVIAAAVHRRWRSEDDRGDGGGGGGGITADDGGVCGINLTDSPPEGVLAETKISEDDELKQSSSM